MNRRVIGRIISISHNNVVAELYNNLGNYVTLYDGIRFVGEIGSYVAIDDINRRIIAEIIAVDEKSDMVSEKLNKAKVIDTYESISSAKYVMVSLALALQKCRLFFQR